MKKLLGLTMIPLLALSSCTMRGPKIEEAKAKEIAASIHEYNTKQEGAEDSQSGLDYKGFDLVIATEGSSGNGADKKKESLKYKLTVNNDGEQIRFEGKGSNGTEKIDFLLIETEKEEGYEKGINYLKYYNNDTKEYEEIAVPSNVSNSVITEYSFQMLVPAFMLAKFQDPQILMTKLDDEGKENDNYLFDYDDEEIEKDSEEKWEFYSNGDGNLTIVASSEYKGDKTTFESETSIKTSYEIAYNKSIIKSVKAVGKSNLGNESKITMNVYARKEPFKIELPTGWEKKVLPESSIPLTSSAALFF